MTPPSSCHTKQNVALPKWYGNNSESISWHDNTHHLQQNNFHNIHHDNYSDSSKKSSGASSTYYSTAFRLVDGTKHPASSLHDLEEIDNAYNITADCLFFIGSVCVLVTASWNFSFSSTSIAATDADKAMFWISVLAVLGPLIYLCNAFVEIAVAIRPIRRASGEYHHQYLPLLTTATSCRVQSHWDLLSNILFGIAAAIDLTIALHRHITDSTETFSSTVDLRFISVYWYFLSGSTAVFGFQHFSFCTSPIYRLLIGTGDILFLTGCTIDLILSCLARSEEDICRFLFLSSILWLVNSVLYLVADVIAHFYNTRKNNDAAHF